EAILLKFLMTPLLITVEIMNLTGFFAMSLTLSQALPIASLPFSKAFGTDLVIAFFSGLNTLSRMKFHTVRILVLIPFHTFLTTVRKKPNCGARCALTQFTTGSKMFFQMVDQPTWLKYRILSQPTSRTATGTATREPISVRILFTIAVKVDSLIH